MTYTDRMKARMWHKAEAIASGCAMHELEYLVTSLRRILASRKVGAKLRLVTFDVERGRPEQIGIGRGMKTGGLK